MTEEKNITKVKNRPKAFPEITTSLLFKTQDIPRIFPEFFNLSYLSCVGISGMKHSRHNNFKNGVTFTAFFRCGSNKFCGFNGAIKEG